MCCPNINMFICNYKIDKEKIRCVGKLLTKNSNNKKEEVSPLFSILYRKRSWPKKHMT